MLPDCSKSECPDVWIRLPRHKWPNSWANIEDPVELLERNVYGHPSAGLLWQKTIRKSFIWTWLWKSTELRMHVRSSETGVVLVSMCGLHQNGWKEAENGSRVEECGCWRTHIISSPCPSGMYSACVQTEWNNCWTVWADVWVTEFSAGATEKLTGWENFTRKPWRGPTTWKDMLKNALSDTVNWQTWKWSNCTKFQVPAWMIIMSGRKKSNQLENCQKFARKLSWNACTWHEFGRPDILWSVNKLARSCH